METTSKKVIAINIEINAPIEKVWTYFSEPEHITKWNNASDDWFTPNSTNDFKVGGSFNNRMEAKDGSIGFDFTGTYDAITPHEYIEYTLTDGRKVKIIFSSKDDKTKMEESFEAETSNKEEVQKKGWQSILDNFKKYVENN